MDRIEEVHPDDAPGMRRRRRDLGDRERRGVRREDRRFGNEALPLLQDGLLDRHLLEDGLDRDVAPVEAGVVERAGEKRHLPGELGAGHPPLLQLLLPDLRGRRVASGEGLGTDVLHPRRVALVRGELRNASAHDSGTEDADAVHTARPDAGGDARLLLDLFHPEEEVDEVFHRGGAHETRHADDLVREGLLERAAIALADRLERFEGRRVMPLRLLQNGRLRL